MNINKKLSLFKQTYNREPLYIEADIQWLDTREIEHRIIKLSLEVIDKEDDRIFYYLDGIDELLAFNTHKAEFIILLDTIQFLIDI